MVVAFLSLEDAYPKVSVGSNAGVVCCIENSYVAAIKWYEVGMILNSN